MSDCKRYGAFWLALGALLLAPGARAEDPVPGPWKYRAVTGLNMSQSTYSSNWRGGDKGTIVWVLNSDLGAERQFSSVFNLSNLLQLAYGQSIGQTREDGTRALTWDRPEKSTDLIAFDSVGRFSLRTFVEPYVAFRAESQFRDQSSDIGELSLNPIKLKESAGIARVLAKREDAEAITRLGFGFRQTIARSFVDRATRATDRFVSNDGGVEWQMQATWPILDKKVLYKGSLLVFQPVFYSQSDALDTFDRLALAFDPARDGVTDFWKAADVAHQSTFSAQIIEHLSVNLMIEWVYDKFDAAANVPFAADALASPDAVTKSAGLAEINRNVRKAGQFKEVLALGISYQLF